MKLNKGTGIKAGGLQVNHNERLVKRARVKTGVRAGGVSMNHNESLVLG